MAASHWKGSRWRTGQRTKESECWWWGNRRSFAPGLATAISESDRFEVVGMCALAGSAALVGIHRGVGGSRGEWDVQCVASGRACGKARSARSLTGGADAARDRSAPNWPMARATRLIAHKLGISDHTVKFHVTSILSKLNAGTRTGGSHDGRAQGPGFICKSC